MKQGMKAEQAASLVEATAAKCSTVKYDVELAEEYIAKQVMFDSVITDLCMFSKDYSLNLIVILMSFCFRFPLSPV